MHLKDQFTVLKISRVVNAILCLTFLTIPLYAKQKEISLVEASNTFLKNRNYTGCISLLESIHSKGTYLERSFIGDSAEKNILLSNLGEAYFKNRNFKKALQTLQTINLNSNPAKEERYALFKSYQTLSEIYWFKANADSAYFWNTKASDLINNDAQMKSEDLVMKAKLSIILSPDKAPQLFKRALEALDTTHVKILDLYIFMPEIIAEDSALFYINKGIKLVENNFQKDTLLLVDLHLQKAYLEYLIGDFNVSKEVIEKHLEPIIFKPHQINKRKYEFLKTQFYRIGLLTYQALGDYEKCINYGKGFLTISPNFYEKGHSRYGELYRDLAINYLSLNRLSTYLSYNQKAIDIFKHHPNHKRSRISLEIQKGLVSKDYNACIAWTDSLTSYDLSHNYFSIGTVLAMQNKVFSLLKLKKEKKAIQLSKSILYNLIKAGYTDFNQLAPYYNSQIIAYENLIRKQNTDSNPADSVSIHELDLLYQEIIPKALATTHPTKDIVDLINSFAMHQLSTEKWDKTIPLLDKAIQLNTSKEDITSANKINYMPSFFRSLAYKGIYFKKRFEATKNIEDLKKSVKHYTECNSLINDFFQKQGSLNDKLSQIDNDYAQYEEDLIAVLFQLWALEKNQNHLNEVFELMEKRKSYLLLESQQTKNAVHLLNLPDSILLKESSLIKQINYLEGKIYQDKKNNILQKNAYSYDLTLAKSNLESLQKHLEKSYPSYFKVRYDKSLISLADLTKKLKSDEALLHYYSGQKDSYVLLVTNNKQSLIKLEKLSLSTLTKFRNSLDPLQVSKDMSQAYFHFTESALNIYKTQFAQALKELNSINKFYIVPDGFLHYVPFDALIDVEPSKGSPNFKNLSYLIKKHTFSYSYSATNLFREGGQVASKSNEVLAFAPSYRNTPENLKTGKELRNLNFNKSEILEINKLFTGNFLTAKKAKKDTFMALDKPYNIFHFAMHAIIDEEKPLYSYLAFSNLKTKTSNNLYAFEIFKMNIKAKMVVLSACNTGYGKLYKGEGAMSLAKAFTYAGSASVVMSQWRANDESSKIIMGDFYQNLAKGDRKDEALRKAKLSFFESANLHQSAPAYWNNFIVSGDVSPIVGHWWTNVWLWTVIALFIFSSMIVLFLRKRF